MAFGASTIADAGGAVDSLFKGFGDIASSNLKAKGLNLDAQGLRIKAQGNLAEATEYERSAELSRKNIDYTAASTAVKQAQLDRSITQTIGGQRAEVAGAGLAASGSALNLLSDSAEQGALTKQVAAQQGLIQVEGYEEQRQSFKTMSQSAQMAAAGEFDIANQTDQIANDTREAGKTQATGDWIGAALKGAAAIATLFI